MFHFNRRHSFKRGESKLTKCNLLLQLRVHSFDPIPEYRNTYNDDKKSLLRGFRIYWSTKWLLNYHVSERSQKWLSKSLQKRNLTTLSLILIPETVNRTQPKSSVLSYLWLHFKTKNEDKLIIRTLHVLTRHTDLPRTSWRRKKENQVQNHSSCNGGVNRCGLLKLFDKWDQPIVLFNDIHILLQSFCQRRDTQLCWFALVFFIYFALIESLCE